MQTGTNTKTEIIALLEGRTEEFLGKIYRRLEGGAGLIWELSRVR